MTLAQLAASLHAIATTGDLDGDVTRVTHDSRQVDPDTIFVAIVGSRVDGRRFAADLHAAAIIADGPVACRPGVPTILVPDARLALAQAASLLAGQPSLRLPIVGVTGTNGKTTVTWLLEAICAQAKLPIGVIGTTGNRIAGRKLPSSFTTPEAPVLQGLFGDMLAAGCAACAMEVSSIGLSQRRVDGTTFRSAVFTSFSQDHLDFHGTMAAYLDVKLRLFRELLATTGVAVIHGLDPVAERVASAAGQREIWRYGRDPAMTLSATDVHLGLEGSQALIKSPRGTGQLHLALPGAHNVDNALGAIGAALSLGIDLDTALDGLARLTGVPGRLERVPDPKGGRTIIVDYAHTPAALAHALATLRALGPRRLLLVFGCGGDRDRSKRPQMGQVAATGADRVWLTNDNPRSESPQDIADQILVGMDPSLGLVIVELDRAAAITAAIAEAGPGDAVLIAGKGHETTQTIGVLTLPFDDRRVATATALETQ